MTSKVVSVLLIAEPLIVAHRAARDENDAETIKLVEAALVHAGKPLADARREDDERSSLEEKLSGRADRDS